MGMTVFADSNYRSRIGFDFRGVKLLQQNGVGWVSGMELGRYLGTSNVYYGIGAKYGAPTGDSPSDENLYYGGVNLGFDGRMSKVFIYDLAIMGGYGAGKITRLNQNQTSYYVIEPSAGIGFALGGGCRLKFEFGYTYMTNAPSFTGATFGFRIDFRSATQVKDIKKDYKEDDGWPTFIDKFV